MRSDGPYLFLQGPSSPLFSRIAGHLEEAGQRCHRINLNVGDQLFWRRTGAVNYRGRIEEWGEFIRRFLQEHSIKTIILHGEERPYHKEAVKVAKENSITVVAIEMGYLRPDWVTVELDGLSSNSRFPRDPNEVLRAARSLPEPDLEQRYSQTFLAEALFDLSYYLPASFFWFLFPYYRFHGIYYPLNEYRGWVGRLLMRRYRDKAALLAQQNLLSLRCRWFLYPLQLETDYQLRAHSPFGSQKEAIEMVLRSFSKNTNADELLVIKMHPLDNGLLPWRNIVFSQAAKLGIEKRVVFLDGGNLNALVPQAAGLVTVNSTAALAGLRIGLKTKVLGSAIYNIAGLTEQGSLDDFWHSRALPDSKLSGAFFRLVAASIQERGNFYGREGVTVAASNIASRLIEGRVNQWLPTLKQVD